MKVDFNIIKDTSNKTKVIIFGIITVLVSLIGLTYSWVANWLLGSSNDMSLTAASLYLNYRGTSPTILAYLAPGETVEKNFQITNYNSTSTTYNLTWQDVQNLFNPTSEIIYTVSEKTMGEIVSARTAPSSDVNVARNLSIGAGETQYLTLTLTFILDEERDQTNNIGNYFVGDIAIDQNIQGDLNYTEIYANDVLVRSIPDIAIFKFDDKRSWCTDGTTISFNTINSTFSYTNLTSSTSCKAYFYTSKDFAYITPTTSVPSPYYTYDVPYEGWYEIEAWGAEGGRNVVEAEYTYLQSVLGGKGGYVNGKIYLNAEDTLYVYIGGKGSDGISGQIVSGGYNGGGQGDYDHMDNEAAAAGGGATDIRLSTSTNSINSRIMVAAGGGGAAYNGVGGYGGGLIGGETTYSTGGTQVSGYSFATAMPGTFVDTNVDVGGGGGGYYGGYANSSGSASTYQTSGAGGSSYISGHTGCVAISSSDLTNNPRTPRTGTGGVSCETGTTENSCSIHYSNKYFKDTKMIDGLGYLWTYQKGIQEKMPNPNGGYYDLGVGHSGNGYARIKYIPNLVTHTILFDLAGGIQSKDYDGEYYEGYNYYIENPIRNTHNFTGWTINGIGTKMNNNILTVGVSNAKLTAEWLYMPKLTINLGTNSTTTQQFQDRYIQGSTITLQQPTNPCYDLAGWTVTGAAFDTTTNTITVGNQDIVVTANWDNYYFKCDFSYIVNGEEGISGTDYILYDEEGKNFRLKLLTTGTLITTVEHNLDIFAVGGGSGGASRTSQMVNGWNYGYGGSGGNGGRTNLINSYLLSGGSYTCTIGSGGGTSAAGGNTTFGTILTAAGGQPGLSNAIILGGSAGGSPGSTWGDPNSGQGSAYNGGVAGTDGGNSSNGNLGQGTTTKEFHETSGLLYAGGGCGGGNGGSSWGTSSGGTCDETGGTSGGGSAPNNRGGGGGGGGGASKIGGQGGTGIIVIRNHR